MAAGAIGDAADAGGTGMAGAAGTTANASGCDADEGSDADTVAISEGPASAAMASSNAVRRHSNGEAVWIMGDLHEGHSSVGAACVKHRRGRKQRSRGHGVADAAQRRHAGSAGLWRARVMQVLPGALPSHDAGRCLVSGSAYRSRSSAGRARPGADRGCPPRVAQAWPLETVADATCGLQRIRCDWLSLFGSCSGRQDGASAVDRCSWRAEKRLRPEPEPARGPCRLRAPDAPA